MSFLLWGLIMLLEMKIRVLFYFIFKKRIGFFEDLWFIFDENLNFLKIRVFL